MDFITCLSLIIIFICEYMAMEIDLEDTELQIQPDSHQYNDK